MRRDYAHAPAIEPDAGHSLGPTVTAGATRAPLRLSETARVAALHVYPVKGCRPLSPRYVTVDAVGFATAGVGDREWMAVDREGRFVTQREYPRLALITTMAQDGQLTLSAPQTSPLQLPSPIAGDGDAGDVVVWHSTVRGFDMGNAAAAWLSTWLGEPLRLVRFDRSRPRHCNPEFAGDSGAHTLFADGYPILIIGAASLRDLNERLMGAGGAALPMNRFRPNLVLEGLPPYAEDHFATVTIGAIELKCVKACVRCQVTTTDQDSAQTGLEPLRTLGGYRMNERLGGVTFGMNAIVAGGAGGQIANGDEARVEYAF